IVLHSGETEGAVTGNAPCALVVPGGQVPRERGDERRQLRRVADPSGPHPLEQDAECLLVEVLADRALAGDGLEDGADAAAEPLDEIPLGSGLARADALHESFQDIGQSDAILPFPTARARVMGEDRSILDVSDGSTVPAQRGCPGQGPGWIASIGSASPGPMSALGSAMCRVTCP